MSAWARSAGLNPLTVIWRINAGFTMEEALANTFHAQRPRTGHTKGKGWIERGYRLVRHDGRDVPEHIVVAERALGKRLPADAVVHHVDENKLNNEPTNLVICPDLAYHNLIHVRLAALQACGDPDKRRCKHCREFDYPDAMVNRGAKTSATYAHLLCERTHAREKRASISKRHCQ